MAIRVPGEFHEKSWTGSEGCVRPFSAGRRAYCKSSREPMCLGAMSRGVRDARWTQIDAIARADVPWRPLEWRLLCQMNFRNVWDRALRAVRGRSASFRQIIARADMPWSDVWRGSRCPMDTNRCHRASGCALEAGRMAIAVPDELQEREGPGANLRAGL